MNTRLPKLIILLLAISTTAISQIPNATLEFWTSGTPDEWVTNNIPPTIIPVTQSSDAHSLLYALKGEVVDDGLGNPWAPNAMATGASGNGFPITVNYTALTGWYKADMISSDIGFIQIMIMDNSPTPNVIGSGINYLPSSAAWQQFTVPITYFGSGQAASASIIANIVDTGATASFVGSYFIIDDLAFSAPSHVGKIEGIPFTVLNPVQNEISINGNFQSGNSYEIKLINSIGKLVLNKTVKTASSSFPLINVSNFTDGNYFLTISDSKNTFTQRVLISNR